MLVNCYETAAVGVYFNTWTDKLLLDDLEFLGGFIFKFKFN